VKGETSSKLKPKDQGLTEVLFDCCLCIIMKEVIGAGDFNLQDTVHGLYLFLAEKLPRKLHKIAGCQIPAISHLDDLGTGVSAAEILNGIWVKGLVFFSGRANLASMTSVETERGLGMLQQEARQWICQELHNPLSTSCGSDSITFFNKTNGQGLESWLECPCIAGSSTSWCTTYL